MKEWRWDRLQEHLRREGYAVLYSKVRLCLFVVAILTTAIRWQNASFILLIALSVFAALAGIQLLLGKQPLPVWTMKAVTLIGTASVLTLASALALSLTAYASVLLALPLLQPFALIVAWTLFFPLDRTLKKRTYEEAKTVRDALPELRVIGITGSVGKTTTKELLAHILKPLHPLSTPAHVNTEMGVARWLIRELRGKTLAPQTPVIVEMGAYRTNEIATLCRVVQPNRGVITFIGSQHLALFGSQETLIKAKSELLAALPINGIAFLNGDCELCRKMAPLCPCPVTIVGTGGQADMKATNIEETSTGLRFEVGETPFLIPLRGTHNVANALLAIAVAESLGMNLQSIATTLRTFAPLHRTFEVREESGVTLLDDTHNASAASFKAAIAWADAQPFEHKVLVTSGLIELGEEHVRTHRELGTMAADVFDDVYFLGRSGATLFSEGYGKNVLSLSPASPAVLRGSLLVCVGRIPPSAIHRLLPA